MALFALSTGALSYGSTRQTPTIGTCDLREPNAISGCVATELSRSINKSNGFHFSNGTFMDRFMPIERQFLKRLRNASSYSSFPKGPQMNTTCVYNFGSTSRQFTPPVNGGT